MEKTFIYQSGKQFLREAKKFFFKNFHQQKILNKRILFHLDGKGFYSFCFCWWKPSLKLGTINCLKNNLLFGNGNQGESNFKKLTIFRLIETDFRAFFLQVETIIEIRRNSVFIKYSCKGKLIHGRENGFSGQRKSLFFSIFQILLPVFSRLVKNYFSTKFFIPAGENGFSG